MKLTAIILFPQIFHQGVQIFCGKILDKQQKQGAKLGAKENFEFFP